MSQAVDLSGEKFGRLTVIERIGSTNNQKSLFLCKCECGNEVNVVGGNLKSGTSKSCGCLKMEKKKKPNSEIRRKIKTVYYGMVSRCTNERNKQYKDYGGRGIKVCEEWILSSDAFVEWAIENGYNIGLSIDRIDNNEDYCPHNCRWVDYYAQANNTRKNHYVEYDNKKMTVSQFARTINANIRKVNYLVNKGYSTEQIYERIKENE